MIKPTKEQSEILSRFNNGENLKIHAYAGTGKTTTLKLLAEQTEKAGIAFAFNKAMSNDLEKKLPNNVKCSTCHSYAFRWAIKRYKRDKLVSELTTTKILDLIETGKISNFSRYKEANLFKLCISSFCYAQDDTIVDSHIPYGHLSFMFDAEILDDNKDYILEIAKMLWGEMVDNKSSLPLGHDGYLKLWSLSKPELEGKFIFVDEAQDLNPAMLQVVNNYSGQRVIVGDSSQQIYEWRGAIDAMDRLDGFQDMYLTRSFRLGKQCSKLANNLLERLQRRQKLVGMNSRSKRVTTEETDTVHARLFMRNSTLASVALQLYESGDKYYINDPNRNILFAIDDYFRLNDGRWGKSNTFQGFNSWDEVLKLTREEGDTPFGTFVDLLEDNEPELLKKAILESQSHSSLQFMTLSTVHQSKGKEWPNVVIDQDLELKSMKEDPAKVLATPDYLRLLYVAITRAESTLQLPDNLYKFLSYKSS